MEVLIENYRGFDISFDTDQENFYVFSDSRDHDQRKQSYASAKKYVDDYIKSNSEFKPFWVVKQPNRFAGDSKILITGIRKDGRFTYEDHKGKKQQISEYSEKDYQLYSPEYDAIQEEVTNLDNQISALLLKQKEISAKYTQPNLQEYKKTII